MSRARQTGTDYENHILETYLRPIFPYADRAPLRGIHDKGDFINTGPTLFEAKKRKTWRLPEWIKKTAPKATDHLRHWVIVFAADKRAAAPLNQDFIVCTAEHYFHLLSIVNGRVEADSFREIT